MIKINYFDERELLVRREIETKAPKGTEAKGTQVLPLLCLPIIFLFLFLPNDSCEGIVTAVIVSQNHLLQPDCYINRCELQVFCGCIYSMNH